MSNDPRRVNLGDQVSQLRLSQRMSIESAAKSGGIGHMTWRKIERGEEVQDRSYAGVDRAFGWAIGHTLACVHHGQPLDAPTPSDARGANLDSRALGIDTEPERDLETDPQTAVLIRLEQMSLVQLEALQDTIQYLVNERRRIMDRVNETIRETTESAKNSQFNFNGRYLFETSREVGDQYESAFKCYMDARTSMSDFQLELTEIERAPVPPLPQLKELLDRAQAKGQEIHDALDQLRRAEELAIQDLIRQDKSTEGSYEDNGVDA